MGVLEDLADFAKKFPRLNDDCRREAERRLCEMFLPDYIFTKEGKMPILNDEEMEFCKKDEKVKAVKSYKERTGKGLMFAKYFVEHFGYGYNHTEYLGLS